MKTVKIKLNGGIMPKKQHNGDAAFNLIGNVYEHPEIANASSKC